VPPSTRLGVTRQEAYAFNQPLSLDTSSVTKMRGMFWVRPLRVPCPPCPAGSSVHAACTATAPTALPPLSPRVSSPLGRVVTRQEASAFNQPLSFDTSSVTDMSSMFYVRPRARALPPTPCPQRPSRLCSFVSFSVSLGVTRQAAYAFNQPLSFDISSVTTMSDMLSEAAALSNANKLLIHSAWAGNSVFASVYGSGWVSPAPPPSPPSPPPLSPPPPSLVTKAALETAVQMWNNDSATALSTYGPISGWTVSSITDMGGLFEGLDAFNEDISSWDTSSVTNMHAMFHVCPPARTMAPGPSVHAAFTASAPTPSRPARLACRPPCASV
jgi:surface protein